MDGTATSTTEGRAYEELKLLRQDLEGEENRLARAASRFQVVSLIGLLLLCLLLANERFQPPKWQQALSHLQTWIAKSDITTSLRAVAYGQIHTYSRREVDRQRLTQSILATGLGEKLHPGARMTEVSKTLGDLHYGVDFLELPEVEKALTLMEEQSGATFLRDLANYHYEGGPQRQGTSLKDFFFADYTLGKHRVLAQRVPYNPARTVRDYVTEARSTISELKRRDAEAYRAWTEINDEWLEKYSLRDWTWEGWRRITDEMVADWHALLAGSVGPLSEASLRALGDRDKERLDWGSVITWLDGELQRRAREEKEAATKATVWSITLELPLKAAILLFPLLYPAARCVLAAYRLRQRLHAIRLKGIDELIGYELGPRRELVQRVRPPRVELSLAELIGSKRWKELFFAYPVFFTDIAYELAASVMAAYVLYRGMRLAWWPPRAPVDTLVFTAACLAGLVFAFVFWRASREAMSQPLVTAPLPVA